MANGMTKEKYQTLSVKVLRDLAKSRGVNAYYSLKKGELIEAMLKLDEEESATNAAGESGGASDAEQNEPSGSGAHIEYEPGDELTESSEPENYDERRFAESEYKEADDSEGESASEADAPGGEGQDALTEREESRENYRKNNGEENGKQKFSGIPGDTGKQVRGILEVIQGL